MSNVVNWRDFSRKSLDYPNTEDVLFSKHINIISLQNPESPYEFDPASTQNFFYESDPSQTNFKFFTLNEKFQWEDVSDLIEPTFYIDTDKIDLDLKSKRITPIIFLRWISSLTHFYPISYKQKEVSKIPQKKVEEIEEPENFYILTDLNDELIIDSKEDAIAFIEKLENSEYNDKLAKFCSNFTNKIKDRTKD